MKLIEPKILYENVVINNSNIDDFLCTAHGGAYCYAKNVIFLYNYTISDDILDSAKAAEAKDLAQQVVTQRPQTIIHEKRHWSNRAIVPRFEDFCFMHYYQEVSLKCLDEISAIAAGILYTVPQYKRLGVCQTTVVCAMLEASSRFKEDCADEYISRFIDHIKCGHNLDVKAITADKAVARLSQLQNTYRNNPKQLFSKRFHSAVKGFFTFDGYCVLDDKISAETVNAWNFVQQNLSQIKQKCLTDVHDMINAMLKSGGYYKDR